jgi:hypothetical protein
MCGTLPVQLLNQLPTKRSKMLIVNVVRKTRGSKKYQILDAQKIL